MTIVGDGLEYETYMVQWMKDHPGRWVQCQACGNWRLGDTAQPPCVLCPPIPTLKEGAPTPPPPRREVDDHGRLWAQKAPSYEPANQSRAVEDVNVDLAMVTGNRLGPTHRNDPPTAKKAAEDNFPRSGSQRAQALILVAKAGDRGLTGYEGSVQMGHPRPHVITTRIEELERDGYVERTAMQRPTDTGSLAMAWVATEKGRRAARLLEIEP